LYVSFCVCVCAAALQSAREVIRDGVLPSLTDPSVQHSLAAGRTEGVPLGFDTGGEAAVRQSAASAAALPLTQQGSSAPCAPEEPRVHITVEGEATRSMNTLHVHVTHLL